jgi:fructose-1,6-bisphosphatase/inositol monophosphatase family enzyme
VLSAGDAQRVAALMRDTAAAELLPRFRNLTSGEIREKRPGDVVTVADVASEQRLATGLAAILPGVPVVGEEAAEETPGLTDLIHRPGESCWIVDPLDGTSNFAAGRDRFAMIVCLVHDRETIAGWILDVPNGRMAIALKGQGATVEGVTVERRAEHRPPAGFIGFKVRRDFDRLLSPSQRQVLGDLTSLNCAGREYIELLAGRRDFSLYRRIKPWDHAAGALMICEAGGVAEHFDGRPYKAGHDMNAGIITANSSEIMGAVRTVLETAQTPLLAGLRQRA